VRNKSKQTICGIVCLLIFSCYLFGCEVFVYSFDNLGNVEIEKLLSETASQQLTTKNPGKDNQTPDASCALVGPMKNLLKEHPLYGNGINSDPAAIRMPYQTTA